jgi:hypothetical protein
VGMATFEHRLFRVASLLPLIPAPSQSGPAEVLEGVGGPPLPLLVSIRSSSTPMAPSGFPEVSRVDTKSGRRRGAKP